MSKMLDELSMLSDILDVSGFGDLADDLDKTIKTAADQKKIEQEWEAKYPNRAWKDGITDLVNDIGKMLANNKNIPKELFDEIISDLRQYLNDNEGDLKNRAPNSTEIRPVEKEHGIIMNLRNLYKEINDSGLPDDQRNKELVGMAKEMYELRKLDLSDPQKAKYIRDELGPETIKGIEELLYSYSVKLGVNETVLPGILLSALEYYDVQSEKRSQISNKRQELSGNISMMDNELVRYRTISVSHFSEESSKNAVQEIGKILKLKNNDEDKLKFYNDEQRKIEQLLSQAKGNIAKLINQMEVVTGSDSSTYNKIRDAVGEDKLKRLTEIGYGKK